ncbi:site-specific integrase [Nesterenkonia sp.]|uniref:site-specific integrase n=1 Tax=Nesterenkonia sp. TaxID=704201 RepID=UPI00262C0DFE|nr:site-specific integrase [Nesterenkonia sp.]
MRGKGEGSIFKDSRGLWTATIELPSHDGKRRRKVIRSADKKVVVDKLKKVQRDLEERGDLPTAGTSVEQWFAYWLDNIAAQSVRPKTLAGYRSVVTNHIVPGLGPKTKLDKITPATIRRVHDRITQEKNLSSTFALNAHRVMSRSFEIAMREGRIGRNPAKMMDAPRKGTKTLEAFTVDEALSVLSHVAHDPLGARWALALLTGARRGEALGLELDRVGDELDLSWQLQRLTWRHGCGGVCGRKYAAYCPDRTLKVPADFQYRHLTGGLYLTRPKSSAGWRIIPLVDPLKTILERHIQNAEPNKYGLVFTRPDGEPLDPDADTRAWKSVLAETGIQRDVVLHGLRHTAADLLYLAGVPEDLIQEILGHSSRLVTRGYKSLRNRERLQDAMGMLSELISKAEKERTRAVAGATRPALE